MAATNAGNGNGNGNGTGTDPTTTNEPVIATVEETAEPTPVAVEPEEIVIEDPTPADVPVEAPVAQPTAGPRVEPVVYPTGPQVVYVTAPEPPRNRGNRGLGSLLALAATLIYAGILAIVFALIWTAATGEPSLAFLASPTFYIPVVFFALAMVLLVLIVNRGGWWAYVIGSVLVALAVYFGSAGMLLLLNNIILQTPEGAAALFQQALLNPLIIASALVAREVAIWSGIVISRRGRKVKARNRDARTVFEREQSERHAQHGA
jgi:hypothetical protein